MTKYSPEFPYLVLFFGLFVGILIGFYMGTMRREDLKILPTPAPEMGGIACTLEAKLCPDGSYVGRTGPKCEFTPCPGKK